MKYVRWALYGLGAVFVVLQFIRPERNASAVPPEHPITARFPASPEVQGILAESCADCHSDNTRYPWYAEVQPVGWYLADHIKDGRRHLNLDQLGGSRIFLQFRKLEEIAEQVDKNEMPLDSYLWIHRGARLSPEQKTMLIDWTMAARDSIKAWYPPDSLVRPRRAPAPQTGQSEQRPG